jgi:hypothetical protein
MSRAQGFMIPLNQNDWTNNGDRTNWCSAQVWWTNQNISLQGSSLGPTEAKVGEAVTIAVGIQGVVEPDGTTQMAVIQNVQAWACYPSPTAGSSSAALVLPSMQSSNPAFVGGQPVFGSNPIFNPGDYQYSADGAYYLIALSGTWTPTAEDLVPPNKATHCCIVATSAGLAEALPKDGGGFTGNPVGTFVASNSDLASDINICTQPYQGQCNIAIVPVGGGQIRIPGSQVHEFGFLAAGLSANRSTQVVLEVTPVPQQDQVDPAVLRTLKAGPYRDLPLQPAPSSGLKGLRLTRNTYECKGWLARLIREAEEILEEVIEAVEHPFPHSSRLRLRLPPNGVQPLLLQLELDDALPPGSVHVFDITQTDSTGKRGGIRVGAIVVS